MTKKKPKIKADDFIECINDNVTEFQYVQEKVEVLTEELDFIKEILEQNDLVLKIEKKADKDIEDEVWKRLKKDEE